MIIFSNNYIIILLDLDMSRKHNLRYVLYKMNLLKQVTITLYIQLYVHPYLNLEAWYPLLTPRLEVSNTRLAPRSISQSVNSRPKPPRPPTTT